MEFFFQHCNSEGDIDICLGFVMQFKLLILLILKKLLVLVQWNI